MTKKKTLMASKYAIKAGEKQKQNGECRYN